MKHTRRSAGRSSPPADQASSGRTGPDRPTTRPASSVAPVRRHGWLDRSGWYEPRAAAVKSTTRQAEALNVAIAAPPTSPRGLIVGQDDETGQLVVHDPFTAYADGLIQSPNVVVVGDVGLGKSSLIKTWGVLRQLMLGRQVVVIDKKRQGAEGEYAPLARFFGREPIRFTTDGGGSRLNLLDPAIHVHSADDKAPAGQALLLRAVLAEALGRQLTAREGKALRTAHQAALRSARAEDRVAVVHDVVAQLKRPTGDPDDAIDASELREWGLDAAFELERLISEDLAGLVDGPTTPDVRLDSDLTVFDVSALPETGPALPIIMTIINTWLLNRLARAERPRQTVFVAEEGWHLIQGSFADVAQRNWKLARGLGLANIVAIHHLSDIPPDSRAIAMIKEADTIFAYRQSRADDADAVVETFSLPSTATAVLKDLPQGRHLLKIGTRAPLIVTHLRSQVEQVLTNTDDAMLGVVGGAPAAPPSASAPEQIVLPAPVDPGRPA